MQASSSQDCCTPLTVITVIGARLSRQGDTLPSRNATNRNIEESLAKFGSFRAAFAPRISSDPHVRFSPRHRPRRTAGERAHLGRSGDGRLLMRAAARAPMREREQEVCRKGSGSRDDARASLSLAESGPSGCPVVVHRKVIMVQALATHIEQLVALPDEQRETTIRRFKLLCDKCGCHNERELAAYLAEERQPRACPHTEGEGGAGDGWHAAADSRDLPAVCALSRWQAWQGKSGAMVLAHWGRGRPRCVHALG